MSARSAWLWLVGLILLTAGAAPAGEKSGGWISLFDGTDLNGWKVKHDHYTVTKFVGADGKEIKGARKGKVDQKVTIVDASNKPIAGAKAVTETVPNPTGGWKAENGVLSCGNGPHGSDLYTEKKFTDYELHIEFQATSNSGVYPHGLYEIQIDNSKNVKPMVVEKDGKKIETLPKNMCGALYSRVAPSKNMAKGPKDWQTFDITFHAARKEGKTVQKARLTLVWNGAKVIDNVAIDGPTGGNLGVSATEPGPVMLQGDHGRVSFRNIKLRPLP